MLLALTVLDELPLDTTVVANEADTKVECNCAGVAPGMVYTARQLLEALLLVSGNDAANTLAGMLGGTDAAVAKMNAKAALLGAYGTNAAPRPASTAPASTCGRPRTTWRSSSAPRWPTRCSRRSPPSRRAVFPTKTGDKVLVNQDELLQRYPGTIGGKTGFTDIAQKTFVAAAERDGRRLVIAMMFGMDQRGRHRPTGIRPPACWTGASRSGPGRRHRLAVDRAKLLNRNTFETAAG